MSNPTVNFRISTYHLARGLQVIRNLEPNYKIISVSKIVKTIYFDYLAKMSMNRDINIRQDIMEEIEILINQKKKQKINLKDIKPIADQSTESSQSTESIKSSVEDFSPPEDWNN